MEGYIGEIRMFAGTFAPRNWAFCQGQLISISTNQALFSILGTTYGGNGIQTFGLPDMRGRVALSQGNGAGLSPTTLGEMSGQETVTMTQFNMPAHVHQMTASGNGPTVNTATSNSLASNDRSTSPPMPNIYVAGATNQVPMAEQVSAVGNNAPINNMQPYLGMNYIICLYGIYPSRN